MLKATSPQPDTGKKKWPYFAIVILSVLLVAAIWYGNKITIEPSTILVTAAAIAALLLFRHLMLAHKTPDIWKIADKIREREWKATGTVLDISHSNITSYRSVLRQAIYVNFAREAKTFEYDLITNKVVSSSHSPIHEVIDEENKRELLEKIKSGEVVMSRGVANLDVKGE